MCYSMERDSRRGHGQWRGCFAFQNIVCDDENPHHQKRSGGLKMGHTYYYYYEVDGSTETFDATMPYTTACPYMPGQTVNTLDVPVEHTIRLRSASMNSIRPENYRTMDPATKFMKPLPPTPLTPLSSGMANRRAQSAPVTRPSTSSSRSVSPPSWKRFFSRKLQSSDGQRRQSAGSEETTFTIYDNVITVPSHDARPGRHTSSLSEGARSRDISPSSLSRILREGSSAPRRPSHTAQLPSLTIPEEVIEEDEDDDNFAASAISESMPFVTVLSPPPFQRSSSSESIKRDAEASSSATTLRPQLSVQPPPLDRTQPISAVTNDTNTASRWSGSTKDKANTSPLHEDVPMSFYDDEDDDDDVMSSNEDDGHFPPIPISKSRLLSFKGYSLPRHIEETKDAFVPHQPFATANSPKLIPSGSNLLNTHVEAGLDDFVSELGWIVDAIGTTNSH
ncbi:hypothetical protein TrVGV298_007377 [Trichoderma virens]|nr:hypothetical protein TrVGV298_007377 [Trichoderma virens]